MKKAFIILAAIAFALVSCNKESLDNTLEETPSAKTNIVFDLTANHPNGTGTKAVKTDWENGDVIYVFFNNVAAPKYLKMSYNGSTWSTTQMNGASVGSLGLAENATGTMRAVYLPFGNTLTVGANGTSFKFSEITYSYYLTATLAYTVKDGKVSGAFNMAIPDGYIQLFLDDSPAISSEEIEIREPHLTPQGIASIAADGTITHTTVATGAPLKGYVYDKVNKLTSESKGYLFSGILAAEVRNEYTQYHFTMVIGGWNGKYYYKNTDGRTWYRGPSEGRAIKMPVFGSWIAIGEHEHKPIDLGIDIGGKRIYWSDRNLGASTETDFGDYYAWGETETYYEDGHAYDNPCSNWKDGKSSGYVWPSYKWGTWSSLSKYNSDDKLTTLQLVDDAAYKTLGNKYRMPTTTEFNALFATQTDTGNYTWTWCDGNKTKYNDSTVGGWKIKRNTSSATIFLPAAGNRISVDHSYVNNRLCYYWTSSLVSSLVNKAYSMIFDSKDESHPYPYLSDNYDRYFGLSIRPISD